MVYPSIAMVKHMVKHMVNLVFTLLKIMEICLWEMKTDNV